MEPIFIYFKESVLNDKNQFMLYFSDKKIVWQELSNKSRLLLKFMKLYVGIPRTLTIIPIYNLQLTNAQIENFSYWYEIFDLK